MKKLFSNTIVFAVGNFSSRLLMFFLVPLYTRTLTAEEYGFVDLLTITITLILPIFSLIIHEAILRFTLDKNTNNDQVIAIGMKTALIGFIPVIFLSPIIMSLLGTSQYLFYFLAAYILSVLKQIFSFYARGIGKINLVVIVGFIDTFLLLVLNIVFLLVLKKGIDGYYYSLVISGLIVVVSWYKLLKIKLSECFTKTNLSLKKQMYDYSLPLIPNSLSWWISNTSDKYMLTYFWGVSTTGIYAVAYKIPSLLNTLTSIFMQAWQISAVEEYEANNKDNFSEVYKFFFGINILVCVVLILCAKFIALFMFSRDFYSAVEFVPILLVAYFFNGIASYLGSIYTASKKTNMLFLSTAVGAVINIVLNIFLIPRFGGYGAAIATFVSYFVIWFIRLINTRRILSLEYNLMTTIYQIVSLVGLTICMSLSKTYLIDILLLIFFIVIFVTNFFVIKTIWKIFFCKLKKKMI